MTQRELNEPELPDDYPIYGGYAYVVDGKQISSDCHGITAGELKRRMKAAKVCRCDLAGRHHNAADAGRV